MLTLEQMLRGYQLPLVLLELAVIWGCVYVAFRFLRGQRGAGMIKAFAVFVVLLTVVAQVLGQISDAFGRLTFLFRHLLTVAAFVLVVVFQPELRQAMMRLGQRRWLRGKGAEMSKVVEAVAEAAQDLSRRRFGALIAIEREVRLGGLLEHGVRLEALVTGELLRNIFWPHSPLHDLGVVIRDDRILAANVQFPLAEEGTVPRRYGSRHRAAIGVTLDSDCIVIIVSEETGAISIAEGGRLVYDISPERLRTLVGRLLRAEGDREEAVIRDEDATVVASETTVMMLASEEA